MDEIYQFFKQAMNTPFKSDAIYNSDLDEIEFITQDCTVVSHQVTPFYSALIKNGTDEIVGFQLHGASEVMQMLKDQLEEKKK